MLTMSDDGMTKVLEGITTPEEVMSHVSGDDISPQSDVSLLAGSMPDVGKRKIDI
jgi:hypothetical protein